MLDFNGKYRADYNVQRLKLLDIKQADKPLINKKEQSQKMLRSCKKSPDCYYEGLKNLIRY